MCDSITLYLPRTKCENVRVLFSRIRLLFGVSVDPAPDSFQEQEPPGQRNVMVAPGKLTSECSQFKLSVIDGGLEQLNKAKFWLRADPEDKTCNLPSLIEVPKPGGALTHSATDAIYCVSCEVE
ncbi:hypothetical protein AVEN_165990-1 [Araneus ventricosus]|uniref:Uncharacterized protein n=1 Tax=Araneus ventricosus TaxID=182803 RepID=A0A4Y2UI86_ARAVE|nr:hypothetical protein AVEN_165990-1 [Araneus ventricosus]